MPNKHPPMKLSRDEELFLRHWIYDEAHFLSGVGPAKRLQVERRVVPADLAVLIAAAMPEPAEQAEAAANPPPDYFPSWPWSGDAFRARVAEARGVIGGRQ
jgi:hypothetical protein